MSQAFQHGTLDHVWPADRAAGARGPVGRWSWPVSLAIIVGLSVLGWSAAIVGVSRLVAS